MGEKRRTVYCEDGCRSSLDFCRYAAKDNAKVFCEAKFGRCISGCRKMAAKHLEKVEASGP